jgi:hypothetical protein
LKSQIEGCAYLNDYQFRNEFLLKEKFYSFISFFYRIELIVDNRVNRSTLSANGIRNAVSLQPVLYVGGIPNTNNINLTGSGFNAHGFQGCLSSFIVDGRLLDYQRALVLNGQVKMNVCSGNLS